MKVLIMVLSSMKPPFDKMYEAQKETWDSIEVENVKTVYYFCWDYRKMHIPFRDSLIEHWDEDWDVIFRTNSSSYVDKELLYEYIKDKPTTNLWIGNRLAKAAGSGVFISRDLAEILKDNITDDPFPYEDMLCIDILTSKGFKTERGNRTDYNHDERSYIPCHHIRCKNETILNDAKLKHDRYQDVLAMHHIFNTIENLKITNCDIKS